VSAGVPLPWGQFIAHSVVELAMAALGAGTPTHAAWQLMSVPQPTTQLAVGDREAVVEEATLDTSEVPEGACGMAATRATRPEKATAVKNFILAVFICLLAALGKDWEVFE